MLFSILSDVAAGPEMSAPRWTLLIILAAIVIIGAFLIVRARKR